MTELCDIHCHILPGVDDGAEDIEMTKQMLKIAYEQGIRHVVATPHYMVGAENATVEKLYMLRRQVQKLADEYFPDMHIYLGNELLYTEGVLDKLKKQEALTINGSRYVLVEFFEDEKDSVIYEAVRTFVQNGYIPIVAHVERYHALYKNMDKIKNMVEAGAYIQVNISSINGGLTDSRANYVKKLLKNDLIHLFGTDAHKSAGRIPAMHPGVDIIEKKYGLGAVKKLVEKNGKKVLKDKLI